MLANPDITGMGGVVVRRYAAGQKRACQERSGAPPSSKLQIALTARDAKSNVGAAFPTRSTISGFFGARVEVER
jgi:hypothetical protein